MCFVRDLALGMPQLGWAVPAPTMPVRVSAPVISLSTLSMDLASHNASILKRIVALGDHLLDAQAWLKSMEELEMGVLEGPYYDLKSIPGREVRLLRRLGVWERHGGASEPSCRLIDDALAGGQNRATGSQFTHRPTDID